MYLDMWRILRKQLNEHWGSPYRAEVVRMMDNLEARMKAEINWDRNAHKALKHLRKIESWDGGLNEDEIQIQ